MFFARCYYDIMIHLPELSCNRDHSGGVTQSPFQGTNEYIVTFIQAYPDTCVLIPIDSTVAAMRLSSATGILLRLAPSGVSLEIV